MSGLATLLEGIAARLDGAEPAEAQALVEDAAALCTKAANEGRLLDATELARARAALDRCRARAGELRRKIGDALAEEARLRRAATSYGR